jgi:hypothetical protein
MGLFTFIKSLFAKAEQIETAAENFVNEVEVAIPETKKVTTKVKAGIAKAKKATKQAEVIATENEAAINVVETVVKTVKAKKSAKK